MDEPDSRLGGQGEAPPTPADPDPAQGYRSWGERGSRLSHAFLLSAGGKPPDPPL